MKEALLGLPLTVVAYLAARTLYRRRPRILLMPVFVAPVPIIAVLLWQRVPYSAYLGHMRWLMEMMGTSVVAFAVPIWRNRQLVRAHWVELGAGVLAGVLAALFSAALIGRWLGFGREATLSLMGHSVTTPMALLVSQDIGGVPSLTALFVMFTGLFGALFGRWLTRRRLFASAAARGAMFGAAAHAIGTVVAFETDLGLGLFSSLAMIFSGILTMLLTPWLLPLLERLL